MNEIDFKEERIERIQRASKHTTIFKMLKSSVQIPRLTRLGVSPIIRQPFSTTSISLKKFQPIHTSDRRLPKEPTTAEAEEHMKFLQNYYSPELLEAIQITESIITPRQVADLADPQGGSGYFNPVYYDDFGVMNKYWDVSYREDGTMMNHHRLMPVHVPLGGELPKLDKDGKPITENPRHIKLGKDLEQLTGLSAEYIDKLYVRPLVLKRVSNQTGKGKIMSHYSLVIVGDKKGMVGIGEGKSRIDMKISIQKAHWNAVKNLQKIERYENRTILGDINHKYHAVQLNLKTAPPGFGLRVNHYIYEACQAIGIKDLSGKVKKSRNGMNIIKGFIEALSEQKTVEELAFTRGKKIVDLRKTYYSH